MAAAAWKVYNRAKKHIVNGTIDLDSAILRMRLYKSTSNASTFTLSTIASLTNQVTVNVKGGGTKSLTASVLSVNASTMKFTIANVIFSTSGGDITSVMYGVIFQSGGKVIAWSKLSASIFPVTSGNTLTVAANGTNGIFTISGGST